MPSSSRHRPLDSDFSAWSNAARAKAPLYPSLDDPESVRTELADCMVRELVRKQAYVTSAEWAQLRALANLGHSPSVGLSHSANPVVEVQREGGLPNQRGRT